MSPTNYPALRIKLARPISPILVLILQVIVEGQYNYSDPQLQDQLSTLVEAVKNSSYIDGEKDILTDFWMEKWIFDMDLFASVGVDGTLNMKNLKDVSMGIYS